MASNDIALLKNKLFLKYQHIINNEQASIEDMVEQIIGYYEGVIRCMPGNVYLFDKHLAPVTCNQNVLDMLGYESIDEFKQKTFETMGKDGGWPKKSEQSFKSDTLKVIETKQAKLNVEEPPIPGKNQEITYFLSSRVPLLDRTGNVSGVVGISINITDRKKMETALKNALDAAEAASAAKTEFIRNMSHDLRTPLSGIIGMADIIANEPTKKMTKEGAADIKDAGAALLNLLNEIIETTQLESGKMKHIKSSFSLKKTLDKLTTIFKPAIKQKKLKLETYYDDNIPDILFGQELLLHRIILNLLGNAVKFTEKGAISLEASLLQKKADTVTLKIVVKDTGIGIPIDKQHIIFEKFSRLSPSYTNHYKGSGLGLFMVKQFIKTLGGDIQVSSTAQKGSQFTCTVQFKIPTSAQLKKYLPSQAEQLSPNPSATPQTRPLRVLLVEDTLLPLKVATNLLQAEGHEVTIAKTAKEAIQQSTETAFDIIYMDIGLPDGSGIDVIRTICQNPDNPNAHTCIAALTAHADPDVKNACLAAGAKIVLEKPLNTQKIKSTDSLLHPKASEQPVRQPLQHEVPLIDVAYLADLIGGNKEMADEIMATFIDELPTFQADITAAFEKQDWGLVKYHVHRLHGGLCYTGAIRLKATTANFENALIQQSGQYNEQYQELINDIIHTINAHNQIR